MTWDDFDVFCHVVAKGSFTAAAQALNRPKSSVSAAVARLERELNARLLERTTRRVRVTETGASLYQEASPLLTRLREVALDVREQSDTVSGTLRIAAPYEFGAHHLGAVSCQLMNLYPDLEIILDVVHAPVDLFDSQYDLVFSMTDRALPSSSLIATRVFTLERGLFGAPSLLARHRPIARPEDLAQVPLLAGLDDTDWHFTRPDGESCNIPVLFARLRSANAGVRKQAALAGVGLVRITATFCEDAVAAGTLQQVLSDHDCAPLRVYALLPARRLMPPKVRTFLDTLGAMTSARTQVRRT